MKTFRVAVIAGDGIGKEEVPERIRVLDADGRCFGYPMDWHFFDWSCETYLKMGKKMPADGLDRQRSFTAIFSCRSGTPRCLRSHLAWGVLIPIRQGFRQYVNSRPVQLFEGIETRLKNWKPGQIDFTIVRENNEGKYSNISGGITKELGEANAKEINRGK